MNGRTMIVLGAAAALLIGGGVAAIAQDSRPRAAPGIPGMMAPGDVVLGLRGVGSGRMRGHMAGLRGLDAFDANGDGTIIQAEIDEVRANRLLEFDTNGDRRLTLGEYQALWLDAMHEHMVDQFQDHDDDGDAVITIDEFLEPFANTVARLDTDGDGRITDADAKVRVQNRDDDSQGRGVRFGPHGPRDPRSN